MQSGGSAFRNAFVDTVIVRLQQIETNEERQRRAPLWPRAITCANECIHWVLKVMRITFTCFFAMYWIVVAAYGVKLVVFTAFCPMEPSAFVTTEIVILTSPTTNVTLFDARSLYEAVKRMHSETFALKVLGCTNPLTVLAQLGKIHLPWYLPACRAPMK